MAALTSWLESLGLERYAAAFEENGVDLESLTLLSEIDLEKLNVNGGGIALGHPVGTTGARLVLTLLMEMHKRDVDLGIAALCIGGGQGAAILLERK